jgi:predicted DNA-binding transcriptional regulator AlpA
MQEYEFTLKFKLSDSNVDPGIYLEPLYESGCDDALIGIGKKGYIALNFIREADSAFEAISRAIEEVHRVIPGAEIVEASPDFAGVTDIAKLLGCTRQNINKLLSKENSSPPPALYGGAQSIWHLAEILTWLFEQNYPIEESLLDTAITTMNLNLAKRSSLLDPDMQENFKTLLAG